MSIYIYTYIRLARWATQIDDSAKVGFENVLVVHKDAATIDGNLVEFHA